MMSLALFSARGIARKRSLCFCSLGFMQPLVQPALCLFPPRGIGVVCRTSFVSFRILLYTFHFRKLGLFRS